jgi:TPR repeat protein
MYEKGQGVPIDYVIAVQWYRRAAAQGYGPARESLDRIAKK